MPVSALKSMRAHPLDADLGAVVHKPFALHTGADARFIEQIDSPLLDDPGANPFQHIARRMTFEDDVIDPMLIQQLAQQQAGWT